MYLILRWLATMHELYKVKGIPFHTVIKLLVLHYLERFKKKLIVLTLNLPNYKWVSMRHADELDFLFILFKKKKFLGGVILLIAYSPRTRLKATQGTGYICTIQYKKHKNVKRFGWAECEIEIQNLKKKITIIAKNKLLKGCTRKA